MVLERRNGPRRLLGDDNDDDDDGDDDGLRLQCTHEVARTNMHIYTVNTRENYNNHVKCKIKTKLEIKSNA